MSVLASAYATGYSVPQAPKAPTSPLSPYSPAFKSSWTDAISALWSSSNEKKRETFEQSSFERDFYNLQRWQDSSGGYDSSGYSWGAWTTLELSLRRSKAAAYGNPIPSAPFSTGGEPSTVEKLESLGSDIVDSLSNLAKNTDKVILATVAVVVIVIVTKVK